MDKEKSLTIKGNELVMIGDTKITRLRRNDKGELISGQAEMWLMEELGEIYPIGFGDSIKWGIGAKGCNKMNQISGVSDFPINYQIIDGMQRSNPYAEKEHGIIARWYVAIMLFGYTPMGAVQVVSNSLCLDLGMYWVEELSKLIDKCPESGQMGTENMTPPYPNSAKYCIDPRGQMWMWININDPEIVKLRKKNIQRTKTADRMAFTICRNNALLRTASMTVGNIKAERIPGSKYHRALVKPFYFKNIATMSQMKQACKAVQEGNPDSDVEIINIETKPEDITDAEITHAEQEAKEQDGKGLPPQKNGEKEKPALNKNEKLKKLEEIAKERIDLIAKRKKAKKTSEKDEIDQQLEFLNIEEQEIKEDKK